MHCRDSCILKVVDEPYLLRYLMAACGVIPSREGEQEMALIRFKPSIDPDACRLYPAENFQD